MLICLDLHALYPMPCFPILHSSFYSRFLLGLHAHMLVWCCWLCSAWIYVSLCLFPCYMVRSLSSCAYMSRSMFSYACVLRSMFFTCFMLSTMCLYTPWNNIIHTCPKHTKGQYKIYNPSPPRGNDHEIQERWRKQTCVRATYNNSGWPRGSHHQSAQRCHHQHHRLQWDL